MVNNSARHANKKATSSQKHLGNKFESFAQHELIKHGYKIISLNYQCKLGEIDIIAKDKGVIVFVEVRYRNSSRFGGAIASVNHKKQLKLIRTASLYLQKHQLTNKIQARFDVFAITGDSNNLTYHWIKNAFDA